MTIEVGAGIAFLIAILGAAYAYGRMANRVDDFKEATENAKKDSEARQKKDNDNIWEVLSESRRWQENHTKESNEYRLAFAKEIQEAKTSDQVNAAQYAEILRRISGLEKILQGDRRNRRDS